MQILFFTQRVSHFLYSLLKYIFTEKMGIDMDLVMSDIGEEFRCAICTGLVLDVVTLKICQHNFCRVCITDMVGKIEVLRCPVWGYYTNIFYNNFLHQNFCIFTPKFLHFLHQNFAFFTPKFGIFYTKSVAFFTPIF